MTDYQNKTANGNSEIIKGDSALLGKPPLMKAILYAAYAVTFCMVIAMVYGELHGHHIHG